MHACAHWPESSLLVHTKNVCTFVHASVHKGSHILCVYEQWRLWPVCARVHTCMGLLYGLCMGLLYGCCAVCTHAHTGQILHCSYTQRMCAHLCMQYVCTHSLYVWAVKTLASARTCAHTDQSLHCSYTQRMCAHTCAHLHAHMCIHSLCVWAVKTLTSVRTCAHLHGSSLWTLHGPSLWTLRGMHACAHWPESSLLVHTKNVCTFVHASVHKCSHILCVYEQCRLWPVCAHVHTLARVFTARTHKEWI